MYVAVFEIKYEFVPWPLSNVIARVTSIIKNLVQHQGLEIMTSYPYKLNCNKEIKTSTFEMATQKTNFVSDYHYTPTYSSLYQVVNNC